MDALKWKAQTSLILTRPMHTPLLGCNRLQALRTRPSLGSLLVARASTMERKTSVSPAAIEGTLFQQQKWIETTKKYLLSMNNASDSLPLEASDIAWIARIPSTSSTKLPMFPQTIEWLIQCQNVDGSWGEFRRMSSTMACLLTLALWKTGNISKAFTFMNSTPQMEPQEAETEIVLLAGFLQEAEELNLNFPYLQGIKTRGLSILRSLPKEVLHLNPASFIDHLVATHKVVEWRKLLSTAQCSNGSILDSVPLTVCAYIHTNDARCLHYINFRLEHIKTPGMLPGQGLTKQLQTIDWLEKLGIDRHFCPEIQDILSKGFMTWVFASQNIEQYQNFDDNDLYSRLLQCHGWPASGWNAALKYTVEDFKCSLPPRLQHRQCITSYNSSNSEEETAIVAFATEDYNACQAIFQDEVQKILKWCEEYHLTELGYSKTTKGVFCYFSVASTMFRPEHSMARLAWAQMSVMTTVVDDYFDNHDSLDDLRIFCAAVKRWDASLVANASRDMTILFHALYTTVNHLAEQASRIQQGRDIGKHLQAQWDRLVQAYFKEAEWRLSKRCPAMEEYMQIGIISFALEPILLTPIFFLGEPVDDYMIDHPNILSMLQRVSVVGRLLNDLQGYARESAAGEFSWITIRMLDASTATFDDCIAELKQTVEDETVKLVEEIVSPNGVPRAFKLVFESMARVLHFVYRESDGFRSEDLREHVKCLLYRSI